MNARRRVIAVVGCAALLLGAAALSAQADAGQASRLLLEAERRAAAGDLAGAFGDYEAVARQWPESEAAVEALARLAWGRWQSADAAGAAVAAERLVELRPAAPQAAGARVVLGEIALTSPGEAAADDARQHFHRAWALYPAAAYPGLEWRAAGRVREGEVALRQGAVGAAVAAFLDVVEREPPSAWTARARLGLADGLAERGDWLAAAEALEEAVAGAGGAGDDLRRAAEWRLAALDRLRLRAAAGEAAWRSSRPLSVVAWRKPLAVAATADGSLIVADGGLGAAVVVRDGGEVARRELRDLERPFWGRDGVAWVPAGGVLERPLGGGAATPRGAEPFKAVLAGAEAPAGYYLLTRPDGVVVASRELRSQRVLTLPSRGQPEDLAGDAGGRLYVIDGRAGSVLRWQADGSGPETFASGLDRPLAVAVDWLGDVYVLGKGGRIEVFDRGGERRAGLGPSLPGGVTLADPRDLAVDDAGRLYVADPDLATVVVLE